MVFLTNRPAVFRETLGYVRHFMAFIDDVVVITPAAHAATVAAEGVTVITDQEVAPGSDLASLDHTSRNYLLRTAALHHPALAPTFVMADDDNRPLQSIDPSTFEVDGRLRRYWFYELDAWQRDETPFDQGLTHTLLVLRRLGLERTRAYASHMPQMIDRDLFREVAQRVAPPAARYPVDEWSMFFNLGPSIAPDRFAAPEPFVTLGWPQFPGEWPHQIKPAGYLFENYHPEQYGERGLFAGLRTEFCADTIEEDSLEKIVRWHRFDLAVRRLDFPDDVDNPWTQGRRTRSAFFKSTKAMKKLVEYATLDDRAALAELTGRVRQLEDRLDAQ